MAFLQSKTGQGPGSPPFTFSLTFNNPTAEGSLIVVAIGNDSGAMGSIMQIVDNFGNTYAKAVQQANSETIDIWYTKNIHAGASHQITLTTLGGVFGPHSVSVAMQEFSAMDIASPLDQISSATNASTTTTPTSGTTPATVQAAELIVTAFAQNTETVTVGSGYSNLATINGNGSTVFVGASIQSKTVAATGTQVGSITLGTTSASCPGAIATFKSFAGTVSSGVSGGYRHVVVGSGSSRSEVAN